MKKIRNNRNPRYQESLNLAEENNVLAEKLVIWVYDQENSWICQELNHELIEYYLKTSLT